MSALRAPASSPARRAWARAHSPSPPPLPRPVCTAPPPLSLSLRITSTLCSAPYLTTPGQPPRAVGPVRDPIATATTVTALYTIATATATASLSEGGPTTRCASRRRGQPTRGRDGAAQPRRQQELQGLCELRRGQGVVRQVLPRVWRRGQARRQRRRPPLREPAAEVRRAVVSESESGVDPRRRASKYLLAPGLAGAEAAAHAQRAQKNQYMGCNVFYLFIRKTILMPSGFLCRAALLLSTLYSVGIMINVPARAARVCSTHTHG